MRSLLLRCVSANAVGLIFVLTSHPLHERFVARESCSTSVRTEMLKAKEEGAAVLKPPRVELEGKHRRREGRLREREREKREEIHLLCVQYVVD